MSHKQDREAIAAAIAQTIYAVGASICDPQKFDSADARARAAFMLVDAFDLARANTVASDWDRAPANQPPPPIPAHDPEVNARGLQAVREAFAQTRLDDHDDTEGVPF